jgi:hypothetical protein
VRCQPICSCSAKALSTSSLTKSGILPTSSIGVSRVSSQDLKQEANNHWTGQRGLDMIWCSIKGLMSNHNASHEGQIQQQNLTMPSTASQSVACFWYYWQPGDSYNPTLWMMKTIDAIWDYFLTIWTEWNGEL